MQVKRDFKSLLCLFVCFQTVFKNEGDGVWGFLSSITRVNLAHTAKHQTPFINQAATKPAVPGDEGDVLKSAWLCFILLPSLERKQRPAVQSCLALMCHARRSSSRLPTQQDSRSSGCCFLVTGSNPLCICSLDLIWGLNLCGVFLPFLDCAALPSWQADTVFPPHLEVISALGLQ